MKIGKLMCPRRWRGLQAPPSAQRTCTAMLLPLHASATPKPNIILRKMIETSRTYFKIGKKGKSSLVYQTKMNSTNFYRYTLLLEFIKQVKLHYFALPQPSSRRRAPILAASTTVATLAMGPGTSCSYLNMFCG